MTDYSSYYHISELIARELTGTLSEAEKEELRLWCSCSEENRRLYESFQEKQLKIERDEFAEKINIEQALEDFWRQLDTPKLKSPRRYKFGSGHLKIVATILLALAIGGGIFYLSLKEKVNPELRAIATTGGYKALLITEKGEKISLQDSTIQKIPVENGILVHNNGQQIVYIGGDSLKGNESFHTLEVPRGGEYQLALSDGTEVWLNSGSQLRYPVVFSSSERRVYLKGEAYFQVHKDILHPFIVEAADRLSIKVLGTGFNIQAYPEEKDIFTTLNVGSVEVSDHLQTVVLRADQQAIYNTDNHRLETREVNASSISAWKEGKFIFENTDLETIMIRLGRWYNLEVFFANPETKQFHFTGDLEKYENFITIFRMLEKATKIHFEVKDNTVIVRDEK